MIPCINTCDCLRIMMFEPKKRQLIQNLSYLKRDKENWIQNELICWIEWRKGRKVGYSKTSNGNCDQENETVEQGGV